MSDWQWLLVIGAAAFFAYAWYYDHRIKPRREARQLAEMEERRTSEEYVIQNQMRFEKRLREGVEIGLPDAILWRTAHIYLYLMRDWYNKLAAQNRYDELKLKKVRHDWLVYMEALEQHSTGNFLSLESTDELKREKYEQQAGEDGRRAAAIENAFAEAVGPEAVDKLREIRAKEFDSFSKAGELAPDGFRYAPYGRGAEQPTPRTKV